MGRALPASSLGAWPALIALTAGLGCSGGVDGTRAPAVGGSTAGGAAGAAGASGGSGGVSGSAGGAGTAGGQAAPNALSTTARRLARSELDNVVRDVLGDDTAPATSYLAEDEYAPFDNDYTLQRASRALIDSLEAFADAAAARALLPENRARIVPCTPAGAGDAVCFGQTVEALGRRLFRRPLTSVETSSYQTLLAYATEDNPYVDNDFYTAVELALKSMLQDPEFLYRIEVGTPAAEPGTFALGDYEIATRVSFLLWGSTPDDALLDAAAAARLTTPAGRRSEAERLLADDRARSLLRRFHALWLGYRAIPGDPALVRAFDSETSALIDRIVFSEPASYLTLFTSRETFVTPALAEHYGLPAPSGPEGWVGYGDTGRGGILSHGSVLAAFSKFSDTSPTQRGIFVQTRLLCNPVEPPPANVNVDQPPGEGEGDARCKTDRYAAHREIPSCAGCHAALDGVGFGLEQYDVAGRFRMHDDGDSACLLSGQGELPDHGVFNGPGELGELIVQTGEVEQCFVEHFLRFAVGRALRPEESGVVSALTESFRSQGYLARELLLDFVASDRFALRREEVPQ